MIVFAGPNGAGKTTFAEKFCKRFGLEFLNPDKLDRIGELNKGKQFLRILKDKVEKGNSFCLEATMSGKWLLSFLEKARENNYERGCFYIFVHPVEILRYRIEERVKKGGHFVDFETVKRRYKKSLRNFWFIYRDLFDWWEIKSNISNYAKMAMKIENEIMVEDEVWFNMFLKEVGSEN